MTTDKQVQILMNAETALRTSQNNLQSVLDGLYKQFPNAADELKTGLANCIDMLASTDGLLEEVAAEHNVKL